ncbi:hypothetical protein [Nocardia stercoris]|nr:hypothetical protein [Nocardia stercoris]
MIFVEGEDVRFADIRSPESVRSAARELSAQQPRISAALAEFDRQPAELADPARTTLPGPRFDRMGDFVNAFRGGRRPQR